VIWENNHKPSLCPGLEFDRPGTFFLQQDIAVKPGSTYRIGGDIKTIDVKGTACLMVDFFDSYGGSLYRDITLMPSGEFFTGTIDWTHDIFEVRVPPRATYAELRVSINNSGKIFVRNIMMNLI
jgi:hypothetical protein